MHTLSLDLFAFPLDFFVFAFAFFGPMAFKSLVGHGIERDVRGK